MKEEDIARLRELLDLIREDYKKSIIENEKLINELYDIIYYQNLPIEED